jgi:hypothetical protein
VTVLCCRTSDRDLGTLYYIYFRGSVTGLQNGAAVAARRASRHRDRHRADGSEHRAYQVTVTIRPGTPIKTDTYAQLAIQSFVTGQAFIQLFGGTRRPSCRSCGGRRRGSRGDPRCSTMFDDAPEFSRRSARSPRPTSRWRQIRALSSMVGNLEQISPMSRPPQPSRRTVGQAGTALGALGTANEATCSRAARSADARRAQRPARRRRAQHRGLRGAVQSFERLGTQLDQMIAELQPAGARLREYNLQDVAARGEARTLVAALSSCSRSSDPPRFFFGDQQRGFQPR